MSGSENGTLKAPIGRIARQERFNSVLRDSELVEAEKRVPDVCFHLIRECKRVDAELKLEELLAVVIAECERLRFDEETIDLYESVCIKKFDGVEARGLFDVAVDKLASSNARIEVSADLPKLRESTRRKYENVATLIYYLGQLTDDDAFLSCRKCGEFLDMSFGKANVFLGAMERLGIIIEVKKGSKATSKASRWKLGTKVVVPDTLKRAQTNRLPTNLQLTNITTQEPTTYNRQPTTYSAPSTSDNRKGSPTPVGNLISVDCQNAIYEGSISELREMVGESSWEQAYGFFQWSYEKYPDILTVMDSIRNGTDPTMRDTKGCGELRKPGAYLRSEVKKWAVRKTISIPPDKKLNRNYPKGHHNG